MIEDFSAPLPPAFPSATARIEEGADIVRFLKLGQDIVFSLRNTATGNHYTYRLKRGKRLSFITYHGAGETRETFAYLYPTGHMRKILDINLPVPPGRLTPSAAFMRFWELVAVKGKPLPAGLTFWHTGACCACGRQLTDPESIERGIGPICLKKDGG